jgi:nicotinamidase-related amidase
MHDLGYTTIVLEDACVAFDQPKRQHVLEHVVPHFGDRTIVNQFIQQLDSIVAS